MQERRDGDGNPLRQAVRPAEERHILQAVYETSIPKTAAGRTLPR